MRFKYIGSKQDGERAFHERTGIVWMPGDEHEVSGSAAAEMAKHQSVWECMGDASSLPEPARVRPSNIGSLNDEDVFDAAEEREETARKATATDPLAGKDDASVRAFAKDKGLKVHGVGVMKGETLRARVRSALTEAA
jgi:hypothetical protein